MDVVGGISVRPCWLAGAFKAGEGKFESGLELLALLVSLDASAVGKLTS